MEKSWAGTDDDLVAEFAVAETSAPDASRSIGDQLQLCPLLLFGEEIAFGGGSETALRADRKILERDKARSLFDALPPPQGLVCDVMMPRLDGLGLAKILKKNPALERLPILFLTAKGAPLDLVAGINAGARRVTLCSRVLTFSQNASHARSSSPKSRYASRRL